MCFHEEFSVRLYIGSEEYIECLWICNIENLTIVREIKSNYIFGMIFDYFGWF